jgi:hypothetical protein
VPEWVPAEWQPLLTEVHAAADQADLSRAQVLLSEATKQYSSQTLALLHLAAAQFRWGLDTDAQSTLAKALASVAPADAAAARDAYRHLAVSNVARPVLDWAANQPPQLNTPVLLELAAASRRAIAETRADDLAVLGSFYSPGPPSPDQAARLQWAAHVRSYATTGAWHEISALPARDRANAFFTVARALVWRQIKEKTGP